MRTEGSGTDGDPGLDEPSPECPTAHQLLELLQTAYPINWEQLLRRRLAALGVADLAELTPTKLAEFRDYVYRAAKGAGIKNPAASIEHRAAQVASKTPSSTPQRGVEAEAAVGQPKPVESEPVAPQNSPARASPATASRSVQRATLFGTTKVEVLSRARAAIEGGESPPITAARLAYAREDFHASRREIGRAIGRSASWVSRLLKWRQSGYNGSPFGPTTRAGRAAHRKNVDHDAIEREGAEQSKADQNLKSTGRSAPADHSASPTPSEIGPRASAQVGVPADREAVTRDADGIKVEPAQLESGAQPTESQKLAARNAKRGQKRSVERMLLVIEALRKLPILWPAAAKAGVHRKALENWLRCSAAGEDGYDLEWEGFLWKFHEACKAAISEAHQRLWDRMYECAVGPITYKLDQDLVDLGICGTDAYARDENGDFIVEACGPANVKVQERLLELERPEKWGRPRKRKSSRSGGVLVIGGRRKRDTNDCAASIKARQWKSVRRMLGGK